MSSFELIKFQDGVLRDAAWLIAQSGYFLGQPVIVPRNYGSLNPITLAPGQGRNGRTAIKMTCQTIGTLPDFYVLVYDKPNPSAGSSYQKPKRTSGYICPRTKRANKLHIVMRYPSGIREPVSSDYFKLHLGTFIYDPGNVPATGVAGGLDEYPGNFHFYHEPIVRHDLAGTDWVHYVYSAIPTHIRTANGSRPPVDLIKSQGKYFECMTSFYFAFVPYGDDNTADANEHYTVPIAAPYDVYIDYIGLSYEPPNDPVKIQISNWIDGQRIEVQQGVATPIYPVTITNITSSSVTGRIVMRSTRHNQMNTQTIRHAGTSNSVWNTDVTLSPGQVLNLDLQYTPSASIPNDGWAYNSVAFVPSTEETRPRYTGAQIPPVFAPFGPHIPSKMSPYFVSFDEDQYEGYYGPPDADVVSANFVMIFNSSPNPVSIPCSIAGEKWRCNINSTFTRQLTGNDISGLPLTFSLVDYESLPEGGTSHTVSGGGTLTINSSGMVNYTPSTDFTGSICFRYKMNNGFRDSLPYANFIHVTDEKRVVQSAGNKVITVGGKILTI